MSLPWHVGPAVLRRVAADFAVADVRGQVPNGEGVAYIDEAAARLHTYAPLVWMTIFDSATSYVSVPMHDVETTARFNDPSFDCLGRYRSEVLNPRTTCESTDQFNPAWGCASDSDCPPGEGPVLTQGYHRITELEQIYSKAVEATLCVSFPGAGTSIDAGWAKPESEGGWGYNCRGSPQWDPSAPETGLPMGDWCSLTNAPATATCHDAWRVETVGAGQAFPVRNGTCAPGSSG